MRQAGRLRDRGPENWLACRCQSADKHPEGREPLSRASTGLEVPASSPPAAACPPVRALRPGGAPGAAGRPGGRAMEARHAAALGETLPTRRAGPRLPWRRPARRAGRCGGGGGRASAGRGGAQGRTAAPSKSSAIKRGQVKARGRLGRPSGFPWRSVGQEESEPRVGNCQSGKAR
jgi:hypothetical protein